ncbi:hypothetical protein [Ancylobacter sp. FA202]|uniref:hypothetical protein n=1 Tax=Ancylobacter sp. FA202 TaxID=1111106 RepID=UPI0003648933|nr:hypothetical protein [Ancylobacter sp. FA202]
MTDWKTVPIEPTTVQLRAGQDAWLKDPLRLSSTLYRAMVAASPAAPGDEVEPAARFWIIAQEVGMLPDQKGPFPVSRSAEIIREFMTARRSARLTYLTVGRDGTPMVDHAPEVLQILDGRSMSSARKHNDRVRAAEASSPTGLPKDEGDA